MTGWIFDHRKEIESNIWLMPPMYHRVWQWLKYKVNHAPAKIPNRDGTFTTIQPGQHATSYRIIAKGVGYYEGLKWKEPNTKTIKSILDWMVAQEMITVQGNTLGTIVTVVNWQVYQKEAVKGNTKETPREHLMDTNNNDKEELKNEKKNIMPFTEIIDHLNQKTGKNFKPDTQKTKTLVKARFAEGFTVDDFKKVIDLKTKEWLNDKHWQKYLRPETLFGTKFESYLNEAPKDAQKKPQKEFVPKFVYYDRDTGELL